MAAKREHVQLPKGKYVKNSYRRRVQQAGLVGPLHPKDYCSATISSLGSGNLSSPAEASVNEASTAVTAQ